MSDAVECQSADTSSELAGERFRYWLRRSGIPTSRLAQVVERAGTDLLGSPRSVSKSAPYKWCKGHVPGDVTRALVLAVLTQAVGKPLSAIDVGWPDAELPIMPADNGVWAHVPSLAPMSVLESLSRSNHIEQRIYLELTGARVMRPVAHLLKAVPTSKSSRTTGKRIASAIVEDFDLAIHLLRRMDDKRGGAALIDSTLALMRQVLRVLRNHQYSESLGRRLYGVVAELCRLAGWLLFDTGRNGAAQRYWFTGLQAAHAARDRGAAANIVGCMSALARDRGYASDAETLARNALDFYRGRDPLARTILHIRAAGAYAIRSEQTACRRAIDAMFDSFHSATSSTTNQHWAYWVSEAIAHVYAGRSFVQLGHDDRAIEHFEAALPLLDRNFVRDRTELLAWLALARLRQGATAQAHESAIAAINLLDSTGQVDSRRCVGYLRDFYVSLASHKKSETVRETQNRLKCLFSQHGVQFV